MIEALKTTLPKSSWPWVFAALRQDAVVWRALEDDAFLRSAIEEIGKNPIAWTPGALAQVALGLKVDLEGRGISEKAVSNELRETALQSLEEYCLTEPQVVRNLTQAGLIALGLWQRYRRNSDWCALFRELDMQGGMLKQAEGWGTPLACVCGMLPDMLELLQGLATAISVENEADYMLVMHTFLAQPLPPGEQVKLLQTLLAGLPSRIRLGLLRTFEMRRPELSRNLAKYFLASSANLIDEKGFFVSGENKVGVIDLGEQLDQLERLNEIGELQRMAGQGEQRRQSLAQAEVIARQIQAELIAQALSTAAQSDDPASALLSWQRAKKVFPERADMLQADLALSLIEQGAYDVAARLLADGESAQPNPGHSLARALLAFHQGAEDSAYHSALQALDGYVQSCAKKYAQRGVLALGIVDQIQQLAELLLELGDVGAATRAVELCLELQPDSLEALRLAARTQRELGAMDKALNAAQLALTLQPQKVELVRELAQTYEAAQNWQAAMEAWMQAATSAGNGNEKDGETYEPCADDLYALVRSALRAGRPKNALQAVQYLLKKDSADGLAHALMGQTLSALGRGSEALNHYQRAIQLMPQQPQTWLALAQEQRAAGKLAEGLDTLRKATQAVPQSAEILLALGEACLADQLPLQALPVLRKAAEIVQLQRGTGNANGRISRLSEEARQIALRLAEALYQLGQYNEAKAVLVEVHQTNPKRLDVAQAYAKTLLALGEAETALETLEAALPGGELSPRTSLLYAQALLEAGRGAEKSLSLLRDVLRARKTSGNVEALSESEKGKAQALMAEALAGNQEYEMAMQCYAQVLQTPLAEDPAWRSRLALGLGGTALDAGQTELAISVLQKATQVEPNHVHLNRLLSKAYTKAGLITSALEVARQAVALAPHDLDTLLWFCDQALQIGARDEATSKLAQAAQLASNIIEALLRLGELQLRAGEAQAAVSTFQRVAAMPQVGLEDLLRAAEGLLQADAPIEALACLERGRKEKPPATTQTEIRLQTDLAETYLKLGNIGQAMEAVETVLGQQPDAIAALRIKADLYLKSDDPRQAVACLEQVINLAPTDYQAHQQLVGILRVSGDPGHALYHAQQMVKAASQAQGTVSVNHVITQGAELARALLQPNLARDFLSELLACQSGLAWSDLCLQAELALEAGEEVAAAEALNACVQMASDQGRVRALQARLMRRRGDSTSAHNLLTAALEALAEPQTSESDRLGVAEAALELHVWEAAIKLLQEAVKEHPPEPLVYLNLARALTLRAEHQIFCQDLGVQNHSPGAEALGNTAQEACAEALNNAFLRAIPIPDGETHSSEAWLVAAAEQCATVIARWQGRSRAAFGEISPNGEEAEKLLQMLTEHLDQPDDVAAYVSVLRRLKRNAELAEAADERPGNHQVLAQLALALLSEQPAKAVAAAESALEHIGIAEQPYLVPLYQSLLARAAQSAGDYAKAKKAIQAALAIWPDEPLWWALAGEISLQDGDGKSALDYLGKAIKQEPENSSLYLLYARALIADGQSGRAVQALKGFLEKGKPLSAVQQVEAQLLLGEALTHENALAEAMACYRKGFESPLAQEPYWYGRLSAGSAEIALRQGSSEAAIAILLDALASLPNDLGLLQALSKAYLIAGQNEEAMEIARQVVNLVPARLEYLLWFADQAFRADVPQEGLEMLRRAVQLAPQDISLLLRLGRAQKQVGLTEAARETFIKISSDPLAGLENLIEAGQNLVDLGAATEAIACLDRARREFPSMADSVLTRLMNLLVKAYQQAGKLEASLETINNALKLRPADVGLLKVKARLHYASGQAQAALACLGEIFKAHPEDCEAHQLAMEVLRSCGKLSEALQHAEAMVRSCNTGFSPAEILEKRVQAAELARALLQPKLAYLFLNIIPPSPENMSIHSTNHLEVDETIGQLAGSEGRDYVFLKAELDLAADEGVTATQELESFLTIDSDQPRALALKARLLGRKGEYVAALDALNTAVKTLEMAGVSSNDRQAVAEAAIELRAWEKALPILQGLVETEPLEPLPYLTLARALVCQAEYQELAELLEVQRHAPGAKAFSKENKQLFDWAIQEAVRRSSMVADSTKNKQEKVSEAPYTSHPTIHRWRVRGQAIFTSRAHLEGADGAPSLQNHSEHILLELSKLPANAEDTAAYMATLRRNGRDTQAAQLGRDYPYHPLVQINLALALLETDSQGALKATQAALENLSLCNACGLEPLLYALRARAAGLADEWEIASQSIRAALQQWQDEGRWHSWAADYAYQGKDLVTAIQHMEKAIACEPALPAHSLKLGRLQRQSGMLAAAVHAFENASRLIPDQAEPWMELARTHMELGNLTVAGNYADQAITLQSEEVDPLLLRSEIALKANDVSMAYKLAVRALQMGKEKPETLHMLAKTLVLLDRPKEAIQALERAAAVAADPLPLLLERIRLLRRFQGNGDALNELQVLADEHPNQPLVLAMLAEVLADIGHTEAALQFAQTALQYADEETDAGLRASLHHLAGRLLSHGGHLDQAVYHLSECVQLDPKNVEAYLDLGQTYQERRQYDRAVQVYQKAIQIAPQDVRLYQQAGIALKESKDYQGAEEMIRQAAKLAPQNVRIQRLLGSLVALNLVSKE